FAESQRARGGFVLAPYHHAVGVCTPSTTDSVVVMLFASRRENFGLLRSRHSAEVGEVH
ncbi:MAG: hypothetical protein ACI8QC_004500, partial [Planctomycetota bacterium]